MVLLDMMTVLLVIIIIVLVLVLLVVVIVVLTTPALWQSPNTLAHTESSGQPFAPVNTDPTVTTEEGSSYMSLDSIWILLDNIDCHHCSNNYLDRNSEIRSTNNRCRLAYNHRGNMTHR